MRWLGHFRKSGDLELACTGTSYTEPGIRAIKDGASWTALEYAKNLREQGATMSTGVKLDNVKDVSIVVVGITYCAFHSPYATSNLVR